MSFVIDKGIPFPRVHNRKGQGRKWKYPWHTLAVGDSVLMPSEDMARSASRFGRMSGRTFQIEKRSGDERGWRVWRLS